MRHVGTYFGYQPLVSSIHYRVRLDADSFAYLVEEIGWKRTFPGEPHAHVRGLPFESEGDLPCGCSLRGNSSLQFGPEQDGEAFSTFSNIVHAGKSITIAVNNVAQTGNTLTCMMLKRLLMLST